MIAIVGPTATGKSSLALRLAESFGGEIISADSVQVYRGLDIGTAKPAPEERLRVRHHLIDIRDPDEEYSAARFREQAGEIIRALVGRGTLAILVGGTGLYLKALTRGLFRGPGGDPKLRLLLQKRAAGEGSEVLHKELERLDPQAASRISPRDRPRLIRALEVYRLTGKPISLFQEEHGFREAPFEVLKIGLCLDRQELHQRIERRVEEMIGQGWLEEVRNLLARGYRRELKAMQSIGYKELAAHLLGEIDFLQAVHLIKRNTRRYAKRQITWFKADPGTTWYSAGRDSFSEIRASVENFLHSH